MKIRALRTSIIIVNTILVLLALSIVVLFSFTTYMAYGFSMNFRLEYWNLSEYVNDIPSNMRFVIIGFLIVEHAILFYIFYRIRKVLLQMSASGPFNFSIIKQLSSMSNWVPTLIVIRIVHIFLKGLIMEGQFTLSLNMSTLYILFLIFMIYVLIEVFTYGVEIIEEQKLTI